MNFQFVNISNPEQARDPSLLKRVRQHVQNPGVRKKVRLLLEIFTLYLMNL